MNYQDIIAIEPGKRGGKPCIRGMRITVYDVLSYLAAGMTHKEMLEDFPYLTEEDIRACLAYAADRECLMRHGHKSTRCLEEGIASMTSELYDKSQVKNKQVGYLLHSQPGGTNTHERIRSQPVYHLYV